MSIMDAFRNLMPSGAQTPPNLPQPGNFPAVAPEMLQGPQPGVIPNITPTPVAAPITEPKSPFEEFNKLWEPVKSAENAGKVTFNIDPVKVNAAAAGIDFTKSISPELMQKVAAGGPEAMQAMLTVMNQVGQQAFAQSAMSNAKVMETALAQARENIMPEIKDSVRRENIASTMRVDNPLYSNPAIAPLLTMLETQFASTFPTATPAEIRQKASAYLTNTASEINKVYVPAAAQPPGAVQEFDFTKF